MPKAKTETSVRTSGLQPQPHGGALLPGGTGAGGRPKDAWRKKINEALERSGGVELLVRVVNGEETMDVVTVNNKGENVVEKVRPDLRYRIMAANILIEQAHGKPPQEVKVEDERPRMTGEQAMALILERLPRLLPLLPIEKAEVARLLARRRQIEIVVGPDQAKVVTQEGEKQP